MVRAFVLPVLSRGSTIGWLRFQAKRRHKPCVDYKKLVLLKSDGEELPHEWRRAVEPGLVGGARLELATASV